MPSQMMNKPQKLRRKNCVGSVRITVSDKSFHRVHTQTVMLIANILMIQWIDGISCLITWVHYLATKNKVIIVMYICLTYSAYSYILGVVVVMIVWLLDLQLPVPSVPISTKVVSSNHVHGDVIKFVSDLRQVSGFLRVLQFPPPIKPPRYNWNIVESGVKHHKPNPVTNGSIIDHSCRF